MYAPLHSTFVSFMLIPLYVTSTHSHQLRTIFFKEKKLKELNQNLILLYHSKTKKFRIKDLLFLFSVVPICSIIKFHMLSKANRFKWLSIFRSNRYTLILTS